MASLTKSAQTAAVKVLQKELGFVNVHQVPRLERVVVSIGLGRAKDDKKMFEAATNTLRKVTGQQPVDTMAKKSIANFKIRKGLSRVGVMVTLRGDRMYEFVDRLVHVVMPRIRDFHGVSIKSFDKQGNYSIGIKEQSIFPELSYEETTTLHGLQVTLVLNSPSPEASRALLEKLGFPFEKKSGKGA